MKLLHFLKPKQKRFVSEADFISNTNRHSCHAIETLVGLRELDIEEEDIFRINYSFSTDSIEKLTHLVAALQRQQYSVSIAADRTAFVAEGQSGLVRMRHEDLKKWIIAMCELGYEHDCKFESWNIAK